MKLPIVGESYEHPSKDVNNQKYINFFPSPGGPGGREEMVLLPSPGKHLLIDCGGSRVRHLINWEDTIYAVVDNDIYKLTINDTTLTATKSASLGTIGSAITRVRSEQNNTQVMIVDSTDAGYILEPDTDAFTQITAPAFTGGVNVVFFDGYFFYNTPGEDTVYATAINDGSDISALDVVSAEGLHDKVVTLLTDKRELWMIGERSCEIWYDAANPTGFPLSRRDGAFVNQGCAAAHSAVNIDNTMMWLDDRRYVVMIQNYFPVVVSNLAVSNAMQSYEVVSDAVAHVETDRGHLQYVITFPTARKTWVYDLHTKMWHERAYWSPNDEWVQDQTYCHVKYKKWNLVGDYFSGKIYVSSGDYYANNDEAQHHLIVTAHQNIEFNLVTVSELELRIETGTSLPTDSEAYVIMRYSNDSGRTWSTELPRSIGLTGEYTKRIRWNRLGMARQWTFEFRIVAPCKFAAIGASLQVSGKLQDV